MTTSNDIDARLRRWGRWALAAGLLGLSLCALVWFLDRTQFFRSYLVGFAVWWTVSMGCLGMTLLGHLVTGRWAQVARPFFESGIGAVPLLAIAFVPLIFGLGHLYPWADPELVAHDAVLQHRAAWLDRGFFLARSACYFVVWLLMGFALLRWSTRAREDLAENVEPDPPPSEGGGRGRVVTSGTDPPSPGPSLEGRGVAAGDLRSPRRLRLGSALGLILFMLTVTFAAFDWLMSLDPRWYSTAFGAVVALGGAVAALAVAAGLMSCLGVWPPVHGLAPERLRNDMGNLLLAFVMLWAYLSFSQYLIIWSGDQPSEIEWYLHRVTGFWGALAIGLIALHFALPFLALLSRDLKQDPRWLGGIAGLLIVMHVADVYWTTVPAYSHERVAAHWGDPLAVIGIGGLWSAAVAWHLRRRLPPVLDALERAAARDAAMEAQHG